MPLFSSRPRADGVDGILQIISMGECDDHTIKQLQGLIESMSDDDVKSLADALMTNLVKYPDDIDVLTGSVKALEAMPFMPKAKNEFIITLLLSLLKAPVNKKDALQRKALKSEVIKFLIFFVVEDDTYARLMMPELLSALDDTHGTISSSVFHTLQRLAVEKPEYFEHHSAALIKQLGSINRVTRAESAKLIGIIAKSHPQYVCKAMPFLQSLASFYPDAHVKRNANEAYQIIWRSIKKDIQAPTARKADDDGKGFADLVKLNAGSPNGVIPEVQFTDDELKDIIELTRKEFKSDAEAILNSLGVGHLTVKPKENRKKAPQPKAVAAASIEAAPAPAPAAKPKKEDKIFAMTQSGTASVVKRDVKEPEAVKAPKPKAVAAASPEVAQVPSAKPKKEDKVFITQQYGLVSAIKREVKEPEAVKAPKPKATSPEPAPAPEAKPKKEESVFVVQQSGIANAIKREAKEPEVIKIPRQKVPSPEPVSVPVARPKKEDKLFTPASSGIAEAIMRDVNITEIHNKPVKPKGDPKAGRTFKCPKCGKHVWAEGQLCNSCGAEAYDTMRVKGHYDLS